MGVGGDVGRDGRGRRGTFEASVVGDSAVPKSSAACSRSAFFTFW